jgi:CRISPR-associated endonuclease Csn1
VRNEKGKWEGEVISTFQAYQVVRSAKTPAEGIALLRNPHRSLSGKPLVMRLIRDDCVRLQVDDELKACRVNTIKGSGQILLAPHHEANVDARNRDKEDSFSYISKTAGSLFNAQGRRITLSPIGELHDPGFKG